MLATDWAPDLPLVEAGAGDLGQGRLNLFSNALYAVQQRQQWAKRATRPRYACPQSIRTGTGPALYATTARV
ncbi:hypothetical protein [Hymenobacter wooponensis]|uniref:Uncharacterized protein n=1 Tax=Hymenobacter wooponensis TaxID=1525360 RepID=A0A4Z0MEG5_9BACT|nr:hypothetical protein [Hymenobacter wooponensis]TGD77688.1 hypothetical protein EU557_23235 [Hymenobacter wooponensis]